MSLESNIADLNTATAGLLTAINTQKTALDTAVGSAAASATSATASASVSAVAATEAALRLVNPTNNSGSKAAVFSLSDLGYSNLVFLGDSVSRGVGATDFRHGYLYQTARSVMNWADQGPNNDRGFGYHVNQQIADFVNDIGVSTTGSVSAIGMIGSRLTLAAGQSITVTKRELKFFDVVYDQALSSGSLVFALNGNTVATKALAAGSGFANTFATQMVSTASTKFKDTMTITASGGTAVICAVLMLRNSYSSPLVHTVCQSGYKYANYLTTAAYIEIATYLSFNASTKPNVLVVMLGTNDIFQTGSGGVTPTQYTANMQILIAGVGTYMGSVPWKPVFSVPPKTNLAIFPVQSPGFTYTDYVNAIVNFCTANGYGVIRNDLNALSSNTALYSDGVHPNDTGHRVLALAVCDALGIPFNPALKQNNIDHSLILDDVQTTRYTQPLSYFSTWGNFGGVAALQVRAHKLNGVITLSGAADPNGSVSLTVGTLAAGLRPINRDIYFLGSTFSGGSAVLVKVASGSGAMTVSSASGFSVDGFSFVEDSSF